MRQTDLDGDGVMESTQQGVFSMLTDLERAIRGESGQVYNGGEALPTATIGYADGSTHLDSSGVPYPSNTPIALDGNGTPLVDNATGETVALLNGAANPINLQAVMKEDGTLMTIAEYAAYNTAFDATAITDPGADKPMYIDASGEIPAYNSAGEPVIEYDDGSATPATVSLLNANNTPTQLRVVPEVGVLLEKFEAGADHLRSKRGLMGNNAARLESSIMHLEGVRIDLEQILSRYEDADILAVLTEIMQTETAFEGALKVTAQVSRLSILDYM